MSINPSLASLKVIARIRTQFPEKFGVPRQSGVIEDLKAAIYFEPEYRNRDAIRGLEGFSHIWLLWGFSDTDRGEWLPTVKPPRLGGNMRMGVFATRSPFRPNPIGLSCVRLCGIETHPKYDFILQVAGADLVDNTPIYDIKPYLPFTDCRPEASGGFADEVRDYGLKVIFPEILLENIPEDLRTPLKAVLAHDPRPAYHRERSPERVFGVAFAGYNIRFCVEGDTLYVCEVETL